jgi:anti-anti-sigma factor
MLRAMLDIESHGDGSTILRVTGECDYADRHVLLETLAALAAAGTSRVIVSLEACEYIDSSIVSALLQYRKKLDDRFVLIVPEDRRMIHRILDVLGLHAVLGVRPALASAPPLQ